MHEMVLNLEAIGHDKFKTLKSNFRFYSGNLTHSKVNTEFRFTYTLLNRNENNFRKKMNYCK